MRTLNRRQALGMLAAGAAAMPFMGHAATTTDPSKATLKLVPTQPNTSGFAASTAEQKLNIVSLDRLEALAKEKMSKATWAFVSGGKEDEWTLRENRRAFSDYRLDTRRLQGINTNIDTRTRILGTNLPFPIIVAPMGIHRMVHDRGELDTAQGAGLAGTLYTSSAASNYTLEDIAKSTTGGKWWQLYMNNDMKVNESVLRRAKAAGYTAIVFTADSLGPGTSDDFVTLGGRSAFRSDMAFANYDPAFGGFGTFTDQKLGIDFKDIAIIKRLSGLPVIVKGIMRADDAERAIAAGADAIEVSNHGGRTIDGVPASISVLPRIARQVNKRVPIILDSGVRRGTDVVRALAMGADVVAIGRPCLYGLSLGGAQGVQSVLEHLHKEMVNVMKLVGVDKLSAINASLIDIVGENAQLNVPRSKSKRG